MALTVREVEAAQPGPKTRRLYDRDGLYLEIRPSGSRLWMLKYRVAGREKRISLGPYPEVSLRQAREARDDARRLLREGVDPSEHRRRERAGPGGPTFSAIAEEWWERWKLGKAASTIAKTRQSLDNDILPALGRRPISEIQPADIVPVLRAVERRGAIDTAHRVRHRIGMIFRYGVALGACQRDVAADLSEVLAPKPRSHFAACTKPAPFAELLRAIDGYRGDAATGLALRLAPLVVVRPGELRRMEWDEVDLERATWEIPGAKMKRGRDHIVPLSRQAVEILREAQLLRRSQWVFPSLRSPDRPISDNTLPAALRRLGYATDEVTVHGFRASFRTMGREILGFRVDLLEHQLAHEVRHLGGAYDRTEFLSERREMMQRWADWLDEIKRTA